MKKMMAALLALWMMLCAAGAMAECGYANTVPRDTLTDGTYRLPDSGLGYSITINGDVILCLHGKTLNGMITIGKDAHLTLEDCQGGGTVYAPGQSSSGVVNNGKFTMTGGTVESQKNYGVYNQEGTFMMTGGTVKSLEGDGVYNYNDGTFTMEGGTVEALSVDENGVDNSNGVNNDGMFTMRGNAQVTASGYGVVNSGSGSTFTMEGGTVTSPRYGVSSVKEGTFTMLGGTINATGSSGIGVYINHSGKFVMSGGTVTSQNSVGVENKNFGKFTMSGGTVTALDIGVSNNNNGTFAMTGGTVTSQKSAGVDNDGEFTMSGDAAVTGDMRGVYNTKTFTMNGGEVKGIRFGLNNKNAKFAISEGTITGQTAVNDRSVSDEAAAEKKFILPGSYKEDGAFFGPEVIVKRFAVDDGGDADDVDGAAAAADLPKTGDPSMLGAWVALLGASAAGMKLIRRKK